MQDLNFKSNHVVALILRLTAGLVMLPHGAQFLFGWFGGFGFDASMNYLVTNEGLPWIIGFFVIMIQFFGSLMLILGLFTRLNALALFGVVVGMIFSHTDHGFFMNWLGNQKGEGFEYHLLFLGICAGCLVLGSGKFSLDNILFKLRNL